MSRPLLRDPVLTVTRILTEHRCRRDRGGGYVCSCGYVLVGGSYGEAHHAIHVARVINDELDLRGEDR